MLHPGDPYIVAVASDRPESLPPSALPHLALDDYDGVATLVIERAARPDAGIDDLRTARVP